MSKFPVKILFGTDLANVSKVIPAIHPTFKRIRSQNMKVGLGLNPDDDIHEASHFFKGLDLLLLLGVFPGFGGQSMQPDTLERIAFARRLTNQLDHRIMIAVDGGVKPENTASLVQAGADILIMGTALFHSSDMAKTILSIRESIMEARPSPHSI